MSVPLISIAGLQKSFQASIIFTPKGIISLGDTTVIVLETSIPGVPAPKRGKVRDIYDLADRLLIVATDRISAFDVVLPNGIPDKGKVLTQISRFWFDLMDDLVPNHLISTDVSSLPSLFGAHREMLDERIMLVKKAQPLPIECIVRGYLSGSGWKDYQKTGQVCGMTLPQGLRESDRLDDPIFTPSTKAVEGHDVNIAFDEAVRLVGMDAAQKVKDLSIGIYERARQYAEGKGIIIADTKFEFGVLDGELILIDEILTPDSSRFWPSDDYEPGRGQASFDKQFVRDYLETLDWDKRPPGPALPDDIVRKTRKKYLTALKSLTGIAME